MLGLFRLNAAKAVAKLAKAVERSVDGARVHNAVLHVDSPRTGVRGTWASGIADARDGAPMQPNTPFISASVGKLAMATTARVLAARGIIELDAPIRNWVAREHLDGLPVVGGDDAVDAITTRMLISNRSGLPDYFDDSLHPAVDGAPSVAKLMRLEPERTWSRDQLIAYAREHYGPFASPGERFLYSDLNWDLLGLVFEGATGSPFHGVVREHVLDPLGMSDTRYHVFEGAPPTLADCYVDRTNLTHLPCMSLDQAGGGLAGTAEDLGKLVHGVANGHPAGFDRLATDWTEDAMSRGLDYGYGTWRWRPGRIFFALNRMPELVGVSGSNNSYAYVTANGDVITGTMNQMDDPSRHVKFVLSKVLPVLSRVRECAA